MHRYYKIENGNHVDSYFDRYRHREDILETPEGERRLDAEGPGGPGTT